VHRKGIPNEMVGAATNSSSSSILVVVAKVGMKVTIKHYKMHELLQANYFCEKIYKVPITQHQIYNIFW